MGMILKGYPRISESFISNEILLLERLGFKIHLFSMRHPRESFTHKSVGEIRAKVDYLPHEILKFLPLFLFHNVGYALKHPIRYAGGVRLAFRRFLRTKKSATIKHLFQAGLIADKFMPGKNIVHLHAHFAHSPTSVALFTSILTGIDFSFTGHAKDIYTSDPRQLKEKISLAKFVVTCTQYNQRYLTSVSQGLKNVHSVYHGIDLRLFGLKRDASLPQEESAHAKKATVSHEEKTMAKREEESITDIQVAPEPPYQIFTIARMVVKKGLPTVYRALAMLKQRGISFQHTLVGDGDERENILALIKTLGLENECRWLGTLTHEAVIGHYRKSHAFVLGCEVAPTGDRDGIPNVFVESMAMGVPVVSTTISAIPEIILHGDTGLMVPPKDPEALADAIERILTDRALRSRVIPRAKQRVAQWFDNRQCIEQLARIYRDEQPLLAPRRIPSSGKNA